LLPAAKTADASDAVTGVPGQLYSRPRRFLLTTRGGLGYDGGEQAFSRMTCTL